MVASVFMLIFWETRRKDFAVMMTHHVATITLIALSYYLKCVLRPHLQALAGVMMCIAQHWSLPSGARW